MSGNGMPDRPEPGAAGTPGASDPSMEDILASIRRILSEDEGTGARTGGPPPHEAPATAVHPGPEVFALDASMMVHDTPPSAAPQQAAPEEPPASLPAPADPVMADPVMAELPRSQTLAVVPQPAGPITSESLVAPAAAAAAAMSMGSLMRTLEAERQPASRSASMTVDELVREELRPVLKKWLDENLAPIVERLVRAEIERVVGRSSS